MLTVVKPLVKTTEALTNEDINETNKNMNSSNKIGETSVPLNFLKPSEIQVMSYTIRLSFTYNFLSVIF